MPAETSNSAPAKATTVNAVTPAAKCRTAEPDEASAVRSGEAHCAKGATIITVQNAA